MALDAIVVGFRWKEYSKKCLESLVLNTTVPRKFGSKLRLLIAVGPPERSIANNVMHVWPRVESEWFLLINDDWEFTDKDWLKYLAMHIEEEDGKIAVVGGMFLYPNGKVQCADIDTRAGRVTGKGADPSKFSYYRVSPRGCQPVLIRREAFGQIGGYDRVFVGSQYGDCDLVLRFFAHGWKCYYDGRSRVVHHFGKNPVTNRVKKWSQPRNLNHYVRKSRGGAYTDKTKK